uniref:Peptidase C1A papain C-terminal domain-containing protein n=1 Tax=Meloidogyne incognita TaxID=6306 RepID=A0A914P5I6_MELIC
MALTSVGAVVGEAAIKNQLQTDGPVVACFIVYEDFDSYNDGVYHYRIIVLEGMLLLLPDMELLHVVEQKSLFWIIRNSWSPKWGKGGFFYMRRGTNECKIEKYISYGVPKI